jgi:uncharacterized protein (DUF1697 family)
MDRLRALFEELGFGEVATFIASGNVIFDAAGARATLEKTIEEHLHATLGYEVMTFLRSCPQLAVTASHDPFPQVRMTADDTLHVGFLRKAPSAAAKNRVADLSNDDDLLEIAGGELFWLRRGPFAESTLGGSVLEKALAGPMTLRNVNTVRKLAAKYPPG